MGDSEETSPDALKNTPSNIAKLEDLIEHSKGRQKYLAQTISPSDGDDVRWYFCKVPLLPNELAASEPKSEIVGKSEYFRFGMRDSLAIEASFLQREEELLSSWWREYAECSVGPSERVDASKKVDKQPTASTSDAIGSTEIFEVEEEERVGVPVKGGLYEVDLVKRHCFPVYWNGENRRVLRGHWFARKGGLDWLPLREDVAEQLEVAYRTQVWHRRRFQPSGLFAARVDLQGSTPGLHALFTGEDDTWEAWLNIEASGFTSVISLGGNGIKLRRGYSASQSTKPSQDELRQQKEEAMDDYCSQVPVRHLVFMVHGIGQRLEKSNLVDDVGNFRHITASLAEQHLSSHQLDTHRVLFIPCQWRKGLKLSGETAVEKCTLDGVRGLRVMLSATVHDVLYYMSPIYCQDIINSVSNQLNRLYLKFLKRNPGYDGKVSLYGHSLGSVLSYDILCHQENLSSPFPMDWMYKEHDKVEESLENLNGEPVTRDSLINLENESSALMNDMKNKGDLADEETMSVKSTELKHEGYYNSKDLVDHSGLSHTDEIRATTPDSEQRGDEVDADKLIQNSCNALPEKGDLKKCTLVNYNAPDDGVDKMDLEKCSDTSDKDAAISHLREEIATLKTKIAELELQSDGRENKGVTLDSLTLPLNKESPETVDDAPISHTPYINYTKLEFKVDTFFAVGSPLGVFLALRNVRIGIGNGQDYWEGENISEEMPACRQMFNIFHPFDPVAYRVEPLVCKEYLNKRPVIIPYHRGGKRLHIGFQEFTEDLAARSQAIKDHFNSVRIKILTACQSKRADDSEEGEEDTEEQFGGSYGSIMMERLTGTEGRIDHMLQDKTFEHPYLQAIGAHTNYWRDYDTALFILRHLYRDIPDDHNSPSGNTSKDGHRPTVWSDQRETAEEELPLTFSDKIRAKKFSSRVKKIMKNS